MGGYGWFIAAAYLTVLGGLLTLTLRYRGLHKKVLKMSEGKN